MQLGLISMIRDEIDIIRSFLGHVDALFDRVYLIDHQSIDGTERMLKDVSRENSKFTYFQLETKINLQKAVSNLFMHDAFKKEIDFLFFLDADEFIQVSSRTDLEEQLTQNDYSSSIACLNWKNCILNDFNTTKFDFNTNIWVPSEKSNFKKAIIPLDFYKKNPNLQIGLGNHLVFLNNQIVPCKEVGTLLHMPIRSRNQAIKKALISYIAIFALKNRRPGNDFQLINMIEKIANADVTDNDLIEFTLGYDAPESKYTNNDSLRNLNFSLTNFNKMQIAKTNIADSFTTASSIELERSIANSLLNLETNFSDDTPLEIVNSKIKIAGGVFPDFENPGLLENDALYKNQISTLNKRIDELEREILAVSTSTSWIFTKPFRILSNSIRNFFH